MYKDNTVFWEFNRAPHRPKVVAWTRMLVEMLISEREWNTLGGRIKRQWWSMEEIKGSRMTSHLWLVQPDGQWCHSLKWRTLKTWIMNYYMYSSWHSLIIRKMQINRKMNYPSLPTCNIKPLTGGGEGKGILVYRWSHGENISW